MKSILLSISLFAATLPLLEGFLSGSFRQEIAESGCTRVINPSAERPNILLIMTDDMGFGDYSLAGNSYLKTPNMDRLASEGVRFANFYVSPVCAPTRSSLLTGRYHQRTGVRSVTNGFETMAPDETTLAEILARAGYRTGLFGKWHLGENYPSLPNAQGFQEYVGFRTGHFEHYFDPTLEHNTKPYPTKGYITDVLTNEAIQFIDAKSSNRNAQPFFCYLPYNAPHTPLEVPEPYITKFLKQGLSDNTARVYGMIENLDENLGRLLTHLEQKGLAKNTIVVFLSDNGPIWRNNQPADSRYNAGLRDKKFTVYEGGIRTQCFMRWGDRLAEGRIVETIAAHIDMMPTLLAMSNVAKPTQLELDGKSLLPLLEPKPKVWPERTLFMNYSLQTLYKPAPYPGGIVRTQRYKLVNGTELYDIQADSTEQRNVADQHPALVHQLDSLYRAWWQTTNAQRNFRLLPIGIGYKEANPVTITPHLGRAKGSLKFLGERGMANGKSIIGQHPEGVDGDWVSGWTSSQDEIHWQIDVIRSGNYDVSLTMRGEGVEGPVVQVSAGDASVEKSVTGLTADTWTPKPIGRLTLKAGPTTLLIRVAKPAGKAELKNITLLFQQD